MASATLPMDIIASEILPRLPAKSLLGFKCVSKFFKALISSSEFINLHLRQSLSSDSNRLVVLSGMEESRHLFSLNIDSPESRAVRLPIVIGHDFKALDTRFHIVGSCNGLICIRSSSNFRVSSNDTNELLLLNPSTGVYRTISLGWNHGLSNILNLGFGYDSEADDHKIVAINYNSEGWDMAYSLKANTWRLVDEKECTSKNPIGRKVSTFSALIDDRLVHWVYMFRSDPTYRIRCFNLRTEQWGDDVLLPDYQPDQGIPKRYGFNLGVLDGQLSLSVQYSYQEYAPIPFDVWIMNEYGLKESWVKLLSHYDLNQTWMLEVLPLGYWGGSRNQVLIIWARDKLIRYNVREKKAKKIEIRGAGFPVEAYICCGSLVSLPGGTNVRNVKKKKIGKAL